MRRVIDKGGRAGHWWQTMSSGMDEKRAIPPLVAGAAIISFAPIFVKLAALRGLGPAAIAFWRMAVGLGALAVLVWARGRGFRLSRRGLRWAAITGVIFCLDLYVWHNAIVLIGAGMATILGNTQVFFTAVISYFFFREALSARFMGAALVAFAGVVLLVGVGSGGISFSGRYLQGIILGMTTGVAYACYIVAFKMATRGDDAPDPVALVFWITLFACLSLGALSAVDGRTFVPPDLVALGAVAGLGILIQTFAWWVIATYLPRVKTARAGLILLLQPVLATVWGVIFFSEQLGMLQIAGAALTVTGLYFGSVRDKE